MPVARRVGRCPGEPRSVRFDANGGSCPVPRWLFRPSILLLVVVLLGGLVVAVGTRPASADVSLSFTGVAAGGAHSCALTDTHYVFCWGANDRGQLGTGNFDDGGPNPQLVSGL